MINYPRFKTSFHVKVIPPNQVLLFDPLKGGHKLEGLAYVWVAEQLLLPKRKRSSVKIAEELKDRLSQQEVYYILLRLEKKGFLEEENNHRCKPLFAFCDAINGVVDRLFEKSISIHFLKNLSSKEFKKRCSQMSISLSQEGDLDVVFVDNYRQRQLEEFHKKSLKSQKPWLLVQPRGEEIWIGPLFIPGKTACYECLMSTLKNNQAFQVVIEESQNGEAPISHATANLPIAETIAVDLATDAIFQWIVKEENPAVEGKIISFNLCSMQMHSHTVLKRSYCSSCGVPPPTLVVPPLTLKTSAPMKISSEEITRRYSHLVSPITGIIGSVFQISSRLPAIHNFAADLNLANLDFVRKFPMAKRRSAAGGKGKSEIDAKAACLCEAIERHCGVYQGNEIKKKAAYIELRKEAIHPHSVIQFSDLQYLARKQWNQNCHPFHFIPHPFDETRIIDWSPVWSVSEERVKWCPTSFCYYGYPESEESGCRADSNGCAAGNTHLQAALSGFLELIERDGVALWWYSRLSRPAIDLDNFDDSYIIEIRKQYANVGRTLWAIDITTDLGIPTIAAFSANDAGRDIFFGFGAHFDPKVALMSALLEMNQGVNLALWQGGKMLNEPRRAWHETASTENQPYLLADPRLPKKKTNDWPQASLDLKEQWGQCQLLAKEHKLEILILDQTRDYIGMPVLRVIVPGLRHFWNRFAPGRLYDVPMKMGWVKEKIKEDEINPIPMFL